MHPTSSISSPPPRSPTSILMAGELEITVIGCTNLKDTEWILRQDPYVVLKYGDRDYMTRTHTGGGRNPSYNESFALPLVEGLEKLEVEVWNSNTLKRDSFIGWATVPLHDVIATAVSEARWPLEAHRGGSAGEIKLLMKLKENTIDHLLLQRSLDDFYIIKDPNLEMREEAVSKSTQKWEALMKGLVLQGDMRPGKGETTTPESILTTLNSLRGELLEAKERATEEQVKHAVEREDLKRRIGQLKREAKETQQRQLHLEETNKQLEELATLRQNTVHQQEQLMQHYKSLATNPIIRQSQNKDMDDWREEVSNNIGRVVLGRFQALLRHDDVELSDIKALRWEEFPKFFHDKVREGLVDPYPDEELEETM